MDIPESVARRLAEYIVDSHNREGLSNPVFEREVEYLTKIYMTDGRDVFLNNLLEAIVDGYGLDNETKSLFRRVL